MRPYAVATIYASAVAGLVLLIGGAELIQRVQRGYSLNSGLLLEVLGTGGFYFILVFLLVAKFPSIPTKALIWLQNRFRLSQLATPIQRISFLVLCCGFAVSLVTSLAYFANGHRDFFDFLFTGKQWPSGWYRLWWFMSLAVLLIGLCGSFLYDLTIRPLIAWVRSGSSARDPK